ncbi:hypothetical protein JCM6882_009575 [Rhodosporidiobolus microsporus]
MSEHESHIDLPPWVSLDITNISVALAVLGGYLITVNQVSFLLKERLLLSSALVAFCCGIAFGPIGTNWISPYIWTGHDGGSLNMLTFQICRIVIGIQVLFAGIDLPAAYLRREAFSLFMLLIPVMTLAWLVCGGFIFLLVKNITFLEALAIAACVTPTDPILANAIVKGRYAEKNVPSRTRNILSAESGANDGLGYPFLFLAVFLMEYNDDQKRSISASLRHWVVTTWLYQIFLACALGAVIGFVGRKTLKYAHNHSYIDHESFLAYGVGLALFTLGVVGVLGSDDVLACFVAGNSLTWKDFYRIEASEEDTFQGVIDSLLDTATFIYIGSIIPWSSFTSEYLSPWRLVLLAIALLLFRRIPFVLGLYKAIPALEEFGPIGVSALYYAILALHVLPENRTALREVIFPVVIFIAMSSTIVHGISIPLFKAAPHAMKRTKSSMSTASARVFTRTKSAPASVEERGTPGSQAQSRVVSRRPSVDEMVGTDDGAVAAQLKAPQEGRSSAEMARELEPEQAEKGQAGPPSSAPREQPSKVEFSLP